MRHQIAARLATGLAAVVTTSLAATSFTPVHADAPAERVAGNRSVVKFLARDGHRFDQRWQDFDIAERAIRSLLRADPESDVSILRKGDERATVFLPTDAAFRRLAQDVAGSRPRTERATWRALKGAVDAETLESVLLYHVVPDRTLSAKALKKRKNRVLTTAQGGEIRISANRRKIGIVDADPDAANGRLTPRRNLNRPNEQIVHGVDRVLRPSDL